MITFFAVFIVNL